VKVTPLDSTFKATNQEKGLRYYMPKPYLLVMALPTANTLAGASNVPPTHVPVSDADATSPGGGRNGSGNAASNSGGGDGTSGNGNQSGAGSQNSQAMAPVSDTSFAASTPAYSVKIIYLPDYEHPMAMKQSTGIFGSAAMKPVLQDGWMLVSLDASADSGTPAAISALASIAGQIVGGGAGAAAKGAAAAPSGGPKLKSAVLPPGLYSLGGKDGVKPVVFFTDEGPKPPPKTD
jgi:hypothetical protein